MNAPSSLLAGLIVAAHGRQYRVRLASGEEWLCYPRGKKSELVCGDCVRVRGGQSGLGVIERAEARSTLLYRSDALREKLIAANVDQLILVAATEPAFSTALLNRCLIAAEAAGISSLIVLNKSDISNKLPMARQRLALLTRLGYPLLELSATRDVRSLLPYLEGKTSVLVGQSGMGKSTLINALIPGVRAATQEISAALASGKHTTTHAQLYFLNPESRLMDSPGLQEFGLRHLDFAALEHAFPEFALHLGNCRFRDCRHQREPGCALQAAAESGQIETERLRLFQTLAQEARGKE
ncbi:MAG: ribosome small subunit-dependent GTPase A [Zoogloeaceae bacterium]|nr:ribosome small subunit-dependent GTPase A [Zoogloeaceae bacterium]